MARELVPEEIAAAAVRLIVIDRASLRSSNCLSHVSTGMRAIFHPFVSLMMTSKVELWVVNKNRQKRQWFSDLMEATRLSRPDR